MKPHLWLVLVIAVIVLVVQAGAVVPPALAAPVSDLNSPLTLQDLGFSEVTLRTPFDAAQFEFALPLDWQMNAGAELQLDLFTVSTIANPGPGASPLLQVSLNRQPLGSILVDRTGDQKVSLPITTMPVNRVNSRNLLSFTLQSGTNCDTDPKISVVVRATSRLVLPHTSGGLPTDLRLLPVPLYQQGISPDRVAIVVPDQPSTAELQSALDVAAGLGRMSNGALPLTLTRAGQLDQDTKASTHIVWVGRSDRLGALGLPANASAIDLNVPGARADDGVLQMAISPWNPGRVLLVVSGAGDAAVVRAGIGLSTGTIQPGTATNVALVGDVRPESGAVSVPPDRTLADLGYADQTVTEPGGAVVNYSFNIPAGLAVSSISYLDLDLAHSALLDENRSGLTVRLNGQPVATMRLSDVVATTRALRVLLPAPAIRFGDNRLQIVTDVIPQNLCKSPRVSGYWMTVRSTSVLHVPLTPAPDRAGPLLDLGEYADHIASRSVLNQIAFVVPRNNPGAWNAAAQIASDLGNSSGGAVANLTVAFADALPDSIKQGHDLVIVGRPGELNLSRQLGTEMPVEFDPNSDLLNETTIGTGFHLTARSDVGYIELFRVPWDIEYGALAVLGSSDKGLDWAAAALTGRTSRNKLVGNFAVIQADQIVARDTRVSPLGPSLAPALAPATAAGVSQQIKQAAAGGRPDWLLPALGLTLFGMWWLLVIVKVMSSR